MTPPIAEERKELAPYAYSATLTAELKALNQAFEVESYGDASGTSNEALTAFWTDAAQVDLVRCIVPTVRDAKSGSIRPAYPKGGFDPAYQILTEDGLDKLIDVAYENCTATTSSDRWTVIEGITSRSGGNNAILNIIGAAIKPVKQSIIIVDIDLDFFDGDLLSPELVEWVLKQRGAYRIRGDRSHITLVMRQSDCLKAHILEEYADHSKLIFSHETLHTNKIEIGFNEGISANILGAHKHMPYYQVLLPDSDEIAEMTASECNELFTLLFDSHFSNKKGDASQREGRLLPSEVQDVEEFAPVIADMLVLRDGVSNLEKRLGIIHRLKISDILTSNTIEILRGKLRFITANSSVATDPSDPYPLADGYRRNSTWQVFTDMAFVVQFLEVFDIAYDVDEENELITKICKMIEPDMTRITLNVFDAATASYKIIDTVKWSEEYTRNIYEYEYRQGDRNTVSYSFAHGFILSVSIALSQILQEHLMSHKLKKLAEDGKTLMAPTVQEGIRLAAATAAYDIENAVDEFDDLFDEVFTDAPEGDILVDDDDIEEAVSQSDRKIQYRIKATNDNWGIYPDSLSDRYHRFLSGQRGASFACAVSLMGALTAYAGYMQVTADPIDRDTYNRVVKRDGRTRYANNSNGNMVVIMQLLFGDSGSGKSYVISPLTRAASIAETAVNTVDRETQNFFESIQLDNGKLIKLHDYQAVPGAIISSVISSVEFGDIRAMLRSRPDVYGFVHSNETYTMSDHTAEIAAIRDAMIDTEYRIKMRQRTAGKLFAGTVPHPLFLLFDEGGAFIESTYQNSGRITSFCELKAGADKSFRRARSNLSGQHMDIRYWGASMQANIPMPKFLSTAYKSDVKDMKAEGVLGRITLGYIERNQEGDPYNFTDEYPEIGDYEYIATMEAVMMLLPSAMRRLEHDYPNKQLSYFYSQRDTTNLYFDLEARNEIEQVHARLVAKIEALKLVYPENTYAYDTYIGKLWEMIYVFCGGHKLMDDLASIAAAIIPTLSVNFTVNGTVATYNGWDLAEYVKDRGVQTHYNNEILMLSLIEALRATAKTSLLRPIRLRNIPIRSVNAAEAIINHHYDILTYCETLYWKHSTTNPSNEAAKNATTKALAERNSTSYVAYRVVENLEKQIVKAIANGKNLRQSDVLRNMLHQAKTHSKPDQQKATILATHQGLIVNLINRDLLKPQGKSGQTWEITGTLVQIQPILGELKAAMMVAN